MSVFNRITDIVSSNINTILDEAEDPRKMVRLMTQEMQETLCDVRSTAARHLADKKRLAHQVNYHVSRAAHWESKAELAVSKGRDDLAKAALREKSGHDAHIAALRAESVEVEKSLARLRQDAVSLNEKLQTAKVRQKALALRGQTAQSRIKVKRSMHNTNYDDAMDRFEAYERKLDDLEGEAESYDIHSRSLAEEIDALESGEDISQELQALKVRVKHAGGVSQ